MEASMNGIINRGIQPNTFVVILMNYCDSEEDLLFGDELITMMMVREGLKVNARYGRTRTRLK